MPVLFVMTHCLIRVPGLYLTRKNQQTSSGSYTHSTTDSSTCAAFPGKKDRWHSGITARCSTMQSATTIRTADCSGGLRSVETNPSMTLIQRCRNEWGRSTIYNTFPSNGRPCGCQPGGRWAYSGICHSRLVHLSCFTQRIGNDI